MLAITTQGKKYQQQQNPSAVLFCLCASLLLNSCMNNGDHHNNNSGHNNGIMTPVTMLIPDNDMRAIKKIALAYQVSTELSRVSSNDINSSTILLSPSLVVITDKIVNDLSNLPLDTNLVDCVGSGTKQIIQSEAAPITISLFYNNCVESNDAFNGLVEVIATANTSGNDFDGSFMFTDFKHSQGSVLFNMNGGYTLRMSQLAGDKRYDIQGSKLVITANNKNIALRNFNFIFNSNIETQLKTVKVQYDLSYVTKDSIAVMNINSSTALNTTIGKNFAFDAELNITEALGLMFRLTVDSGVGNLSDTVTVNTDLNAYKLGQITEHVLSWQELFSQK